MKQSGVSKEKTSPNDDRMADHKPQSKNLFDYNIFLIGFMGAGKSTVADNLEKMSGMKRIEMDMLIQKQKGMSIPEIFEAFGESYFRDLESELLIELQQKSPSIVSCGGGIVIRSENAEHMKKNGRVIWLKAEPQTIYERVKDSGERPILNNNMNVEFIKDLFEKRRKKYEKAADLIIETDGKNIVEICEEIISKLMLLDKQN